MPVKLDIFLKWRMSEPEDIGGSELKYITNYPGFFLF
jgi:hypothetical protein